MLIDKNVRLAIAISFWVELKLCKIQLLIACLENIECLPGWNNQNLVEVPILSSFFQKDCLGVYKIAVWDTLQLIDGAQDTAKISFINKI